MNIEFLRSLPRISRNGETSQLGLWLQANTHGDTEMSDLVMSVMAEQNGCLGTRDDRGVPMVGDVTPGHSRELLRRLDLREKSDR